MWVLNIIETYKEIFRELFLLMSCTGLTPNSEGFNVSDWINGAY